MTDQISIQYHGHGPGACHRCGAQSPDLGSIAGGRGVVYVCESCAQLVRDNDHETFEWAARNVLAH